MEKENRKELLAIFKKNKVMRNFTLISLFIGIFLFAIGIIINSRSLPAAVDIDQVEGANVYSQGKIYALTGCFATYDVDNTVTDEYYIALGENNLLYILNMSKGLYNEIANKMDDENYEEDVVVTGMTEDIPTELKNMAIDVYNELYEEQIDESKFDSNFVPYVLNLKRGPNDSSNIFSGLAIVAFIFAYVSGLIWIITIIRTRLNVKKISKKYDLAQISIELSSPTKVEFKRTKTIFLENYVICYSNILEVIKYSDIAWIYPFEMRTNGVKSSIKIIVVTKDGKRHNIAFCSVISKKNTEEFADTYNEMIARLPGILIGYTQENITAMSKKNINETIAKLNEKDNTL